MNYIEYTPEDFLSDDSFLNYCMHKSKEDVQFWTNWLQQNPQKSSEVRKAKELYAILNGNLASQVQEDQQLFTTLFQQHLLTSQREYESKPGTRSVFVRRVLYTTLGAVAAVVVAFFIIPRYVQPSGPDDNNQTVYSHVSQPGEKKFFQLADGSQINLNSGSSIRIAKGFNEAKREIFLEGEAYFEIAHNAGKPFIIHTKWMDIKVLGTVFNVKAYPTDPEAETSLISGLVEVTLKSRNNKKVILKPREKITISIQSALQATEKPVTASDVRTAAYKISGLNIAPIDSSVAEISWMKNQVLFANESFDRIAVELERNYDIKIVFENEEVRNYRYTATFDKKTINQILEALKLSRSFNYEFEDGNKIIIRK